MAIGMTYDEYWYGDPLMVRAYYKAEQMRRKIADENAWLQGLYVREALLATVGNMFKEKSAQPYEYPKLPQLLQKEQDERAEREKTEREREEEATWALAWMSSFVQAGKNFGKNKTREG